MLSLRPALPRTYQAFLGRFDRPTEIQQRAVPSILDGADVLLCAPTASGKTEAYAAPAVEMLLADSATPAPASLLLISPTRALANDLFRRLQARMDEVGVSFGRRTAEHKELVDGNLPSALILTPEGLDSLLARRAEALAQVRTIVLDEIHVLDNTPRGDQLRILLSRLELCARERPQRLAASATVESPEALAARYLREAEVHVVAGARRLRRRLFQGTTPLAFRSHLTELAQSGLRKVLVFCNNRRSVEELSHALRNATPFRDQVYPHHGSLSRVIRERTERRFLDAPAAVAISTLTLELGIDIGDVDYVLLNEPPPSISSLLQRVGRGGRRGESTRLGCACRHAADQLVFDAMLRCGARGELHEHPYAFRPSVLVQQALTLAGARGRITAPELQSALPAGLVPEPRESFARNLLDHMVQHELCEPPRSGHYVLEGDVEQRYDRGQLHANFTDAANLELVDRLTGDVLGKISSVALKDKVGLAGDGRRFVMQRDGQLLTDAGGKSEPAQFNASTSPLVSFGQSRAIAVALGAGAREVHQHHIGTRWCLVHGLGTLGGLLLAELAGQLVGAHNVGEPTGYSLGLATELKAWPEFSPGALEAFTRRHSARLTKLCGMGPHHGVLPEEVRELALRAATGLAQVSEYANTCKLHSSEVDPERAELLRDL